MGRRWELEEKEEARGEKEGARELVLCPRRKKKSRRLFIICRDMVSVSNVSVSRRFLNVSVSSHLVSY
jgi:hypothetical protein